MRKFLICMCFIFLVACTENNNSIVIEGGSVLVACTDFRKSCPLSDDQRTAPLGYYPNLFECHYKLLQFKEHGFSSGDPICIPCKNITYQLPQKTFYCDWSL